MVRLIPRVQILELSSPCPRIRQDPSIHASIHPPPGIMSRPEESILTLDRSLHRPPRRPRPRPRQGCLPSLRSLSLRLGFQIQRRISIAIAISISIIITPKRVRSNKQLPRASNSAKRSEKKERKERKELSLRERGDAPVFHYTFVCVGGSRSLEVQDKWHTRLLLE